MNQEEKTLRMINIRKSNGETQQEACEFKESTQVEGVKSTGSKGNFLKLYDIN